MSKRFAAIAFLALASISTVGAGRAHAQEPATPPLAGAETHDVPAGAEPEAAHPVDPSRGFNFTDLHYTGSPFGEGEHGQAHAGAEGEHEGVPAPFLYLVLNFVALLVILAWKAGPAARKAAEKRSDEIKKALDEAAHLRNQAKAKLDEYQAKLSAAEKEIAAMVEGMRADAEADKKRIIAAAEAQAIALKKDAEERIHAEILRARALLTREVSHAATVAAEALIRDKATAADQAHMVEAFITDVAAGKPVAKETI